MAANYHYVPQFYLRRFTDEHGSLWVWDKLEDRIFRTAPENTAAERDFYLLDHLREFGPSAPLEMEKQFSQLENDAHLIFNYWEHQSTYSDKIEIPPVHRETIALFVTLQLYRTREAKTQLIEIFRLAMTPDATKEALADTNKFHADFIWNAEVMNSVAQHVQKFIWIPAVNNSGVDFLTSDHPAQLKSHDNKEWIMGPRLYDRGIQIIYPLSPTVMLYMHEPSYWEKLKKFDGKISQVTFTAYMAEHENSGQIGMSHRFVYSNKNDFSFARQYAPKHPEIRDPNRARFEVRKTKSE